MLGALGATNESSAEENYRQHLEAKHS